MSKRERPCQGFYKFLNSLSSVDTLDTVNTIPRDKTKFLKLSSSSVASELPTDVYHIQTIFHHRKAKVSVAESVCT